MSNYKSISLHLTAKLVIRFRLGPESTSTFLLTYRGWDEGLVESPQFPLPLLQLSSQRPTLLCSRCRLLPCSDQLSEQGIRNVLERACYRIGCFKKEPTGSVFCIRTGTGPDKIVYYPAGSGSSRISRRYRILEFKRFLYLGRWKLRSYPLLLTALYNVTSIADSSIYRGS